MIFKMRPFTDRQLKKWESCQNRGKTKYIVTLWISWSLFTATIIPFVYLIFDGFSDSSKQELIHRFTSVETIIRYSVFLIIGYLYAKYIWNQNQKRYNHTIELKENNI